MKILYYTNFFDAPLTSAEGFEPALVKNCCEILTDRTRLDEADAVVFHLPNLKSEVLPEKPSGQIWAALSNESTTHYPFQRDKEFMRSFDVRMMLNQDSEIPLVDFRPYMLSGFRSRPRWKYRRAPAVYFGANPGVGRERADWLHRIAAVMRTDRYGRGKGSRCIWRDQGPTTKLRVISRYHFYFAFENAIERDYVSEKIYDGLVAGTVPVYLGAPNVEDFLPAPKCAVFAHDFASPEDLAHHLIDLRADRRRYDEYLAWRQRPFSKSFLRMAEVNAVPTILRLYWWLRSNPQTRE